MERLIIWPICFWVVFVSMVAVLWLGVEITGWVIDVLNEWAEALPGEGALE